MHPVLVVNRTVQQCSPDEVCIKRTSPESEYHRTQCIILRLSYTSTLGWAESYLYMLFVLNAPHVSELSPLQGVLHEFSGILGCSTPPNSSPQEHLLEDARPDDIVHISIAMIFTVAVHVLQILQRLRLDDETLDVVMNMSTTVILMHSQGQLCQPSVLRKAIEMYAYSGICDSQHKDACVCILYRSNIAAEGAALPHTQAETCSLYAQPNLP